MRTLDVSDVGDFSGRPAHIRLATRSFHVRQGIPRGRFYSYRGSLPRGATAWGS